MTSLEVQADATGLDAVSLAGSFGAADWSFATEPRTEGQFHPYPARYIPALPRQIMDLVGIADGLVLDPFCGSGTTLAEARRRGLGSIGVDINPVACLISRVRTTPWQSHDEQDVDHHLAGLRAAAREALALGEEFADIPRVDHWFPDYAQVALSGAIRYVRSIPVTDPWHDRVAAAVSAATVRVSRQDSDTRYAAIDKAGDQESVAAALERSLRKTVSWLRNNNAFNGGDVTTQVLMRDARDLAPVPTEAVSLACFSPPYPNAYEYWLYHKYRMYWLGFDAVDVRQKEIGARPFYSKKNGLTEVDFANQMAEVFTGLRRVVRSSGHVAVVVGDSVIGGRPVDNGTLLCDVATSTGFSVVYAGSRGIATGKSSFNRAHSRGRRTEHVLVFGA